MVEKFGESWVLLIYLSRLSHIIDSEAVVQRYSIKKVLFEISQNSRESTCAWVHFLIKLQA